MWKNHQSWFNGTSQLCRKSVCGICVICITSHQSHCVVHGMHAYRSNLFQIDRSKNVEPNDWNRLKTISLTRFNWTSLGIILQSQGLNKWQFFVIDVPKHTRSCHKKLKRKILTITWKNQNKTTKMNTNLIILFVSI